MKICIIGNPNSIHVHRWVKYFISKQDIIHWIGEHTLGTAIPQGVIFHDLTRATNVRKLRYLIWALQTRRLLLEIKPDILHAHSVVSAGWLGAATGYHPFLITAHGSDLLLLDQHSWFFQKLTKWTLLKADYVTCVSENLAVKAKVLGAKPERVEVVPLGVHLNTFRPSLNPQIIRQRLGLGAEPIVLSIRAMNPIYNLLDIAQAIPLVLEQVPQIRFLIFAYNIDHDYHSRFTEYLTDEIKSGSVRLVQNLPNDQAIAEYYHACNVAISVPSSDGTPVSVLEAMACGAAVIASDLPSLHDWISPEQDGLVVPVGDIQAITNAIIRLVRDAPLRNRMGTKAAVRIQKQGDNQFWMQRIMRIYDALTK